MLDMSHKKPISSVSQLPRTVTDNGSKKKKPKVVTGSPRKTTLSVEKKTKVPSDTIVKPLLPGKRDKQLTCRTYQHEIGTYEHIQGLDIILE